MEMLKVIAIHAQSKRLLGGLTFFLAFMMVFTPAFAAAQGSIIITSDRTIDENQEYSNVTVFGDVNVENNANIGALVVQNNDDGTMTFLHSGQLTQVGGTFTNNGKTIGSATIYNGEFINNNSGSILQSVVNMTVLDGSSVVNDGRIGICEIGDNARYGGLIQIGGNVVNNNHVSILNMTGGTLENNRRVAEVYMEGGTVTSYDSIETAVVSGQGKLVNTYRMKEDGITPTGGSIDSLTLHDGGVVENSHRVVKLDMDGGTFVHNATEDNFKASLQEHYFIHEADISAGDFYLNGNVVSMVLQGTAELYTYATSGDMNDKLTGYIKNLVMQDDAVIKFAVDSLNDYSQLNIGYSDVPGIINRYDEEGNPIAVSEGVGTFDINASGIIVDFGDSFANVEEWEFDLKKLFAFDSVFDFDGWDWDSFQLNNIEDYTIVGSVVYYSGDGVDLNSVSNPEPATLAILGLAFAGAGFVARRKNRK